MQTMVPLYGFGGGGGTGAALTVNAPAGCTVTVSKDGKTKTKTVGADGVAVFKGLVTGQWTLSITDGEQTAQKTVTITADYSTAITFFSATIHVTYPAGSTCTATDGVTTLTAPDTSGTWDCVVPNAGTWTVSLDSGFAEKVSATEMNGTYTVDKWYLYNLGDEHTAVTGGWSNDGWKAAAPYEAQAPQKNADNMRIWSQGMIMHLAGTANCINFSGFSKIRAEGIVDGHNGYDGTYFSIYLELNPDKLGNNINALGRAWFGLKSTEKVTKEISLEGIDSAYVCIPTASIDGCDGRIYRVWLEV